MKSVGSYEAKTHLPRLLSEVEHGETITITKRGKPVAKLIPVQEQIKPEVTSVIEQMKAFRKGQSLGGMSIREMIDEGRRF